MKKFLLLLFVLSLCLFAACGEKTDLETEEAELDAVSSTMNGTMTKYTGSEITIEPAEGTSYTFGCEKAQLQCKNGLTPGNQVQLVYVGGIDGTNTDNVRVRRIITSDDNTGVWEIANAAADGVITQPQEEETPKEAGYDTPASGTPGEETKETACISGYVNVRADAQSDGEILGTLSPGDEITVTGICQNGWIRIPYNGGTAYIWQDFVSW